MSPSSPRSIGIDPHHPPPHRSMSMASPVLSPARALGGQGTGPAHRQSMVGRSYRDDPETARERQMQQDIESAMSMSRARSGSLAADSPPVLMRPSHQHFQATSPIDETPFPMLSEAEEAEMNRARSSGFHDHEHGSDEGHHDGGYRHHEERGDEMEAGHDHRSTDASSGRGGYDAHAPLLRRHSDDERHVHERRSHGHMHMRRPDDARSMGGMGMRNTFDFGAMEEFAAKEQGAEGGPGMSIPGPRRGSAAPVSASYDIAAPTGTFSASAHWDEEGMLSPKESDVGSHQAFARRRQRKLSASNPVTRRGGKLALFEGFGGGDGEPQEGALPFKAPRQARLGSQPGGQGTFQAYTDAVPGHDKPYRFSFYSNALPVTIHARSLAELPAEGQTFEDLFKGRNMSLNEREADGTGTDYAGSLGTGKGTSGYDTPDRDGTGAGAGGKMSMLARAAGAAMKDGRRESVGGPGGVGSPDEQDPEAYTWWLDVQSPTDEEMRMLSKVFGIHPLTTEDILLEETREKIELFRNYYLVCFRSFDQDPYSQTYLEPLNMYIIVFREGTLSFHFRGTPHPQNVRRRIKHLKDYISVTSDWISYALIDDITDAFGPLIQSIEYEVDSIDELVLILKDAEQSDMLRRIGTCRKKVMGLLRLMGNKADVVKGLAKRCNEQWLVAPKSDIGLYLSDIQDHLITMTQNLNHYEKILSRSHSNYLAQISIEMTDANNQINDVLSKLTALGTVLIPMNLVTGLWGMNVHVPGQDITEGYAWFGGILGCLAAFAVVGAFATWKCFVR